MRAPLQLVLAVILLLTGSTDTGAAPTTLPQDRPATAAGDRALVVIENPVPGVSTDLLAADVMVVRDLERYLLVAATASDRRRFTERGLVWRVLDGTMAGRTYYTVVLGHPDRVRALESSVRVLRADRWDAVIEATPERADRLAGDGFEIARVFVRPIRPPRSVSGDAPVQRRLVADPAIQSIVDAVSTTRIDADVQRLQDFVTRYSSHDSCYAAAQYIKAEFLAAGIDSVYLQDYHSTYHENVVAVIPGAGQPDKVVVVGGHYDSTTGNQNVAPGADDDASGTACVLECARVLANTQFNYTLKFVAFSGEEQGLHGSEAFAAAEFAAGNDVVAVVCVDMIGYVAGGDAVDLDIIDNGSSVWLRDLTVSAASMYVPGFSVVDGALPGGASSDHASFWAYGYDAILFFEDTGNYSPYIHTANDVVGISYNHSVMAERSVKTAAAVLATVADPFDVAISHTPLTHTEDTTNPYPVSATIITATELDPDSLMVRYSTGGGTLEAMLTPSGPPDEFAGAIPAQAGGTWVDYWVVAADTAGNVATDPAGAPTETHRFFVGTITTVLANEMESPSGFAVGDTDDDATTGIWAHGDPHGTWSPSVLVQPEDDHTPAGTMCWVTGNQAGASHGSDDVDGGKTTLFSPIYDLSPHPNARVRYHRWYTNDTGSSPGLDEWVVDVSSNGGSNWSRLETTTASDRSWRLVEFELAELTSQVQFRFIASDEGSGSIVEAGVDDFSIVVYQSSPTEAPDVAAATAARLDLQQNAPNPFGRGTEIAFTVPASGEPVTLRVFDVSGRLVTTLLHREPLAGPQTVQWDGRDAAGRRVSSGVYFYRLDAGERSLARRMVTLR